MSLHMYTFYSEVRNGLMEFYCDFSIDGRILNQSCIPYKYFLSGKEKPYEFLHETKSYGNEVVNRCLVISAEKVKLGGMSLIYNIVRIKVSVSRPSTVSRLSM